MTPPLPPGQRARPDLPRFGLPQFAGRQPRPPFQARLRLLGPVLPQADIDHPLQGLSRVELTQDFHCVTTWSCRGLRWGGVRFAEFYARHVQPRQWPGSTVRYVTAQGSDGYRTTLYLPDLLADDALLADTLDSAPLSAAHGAPWRLVLPAQYGYKSVKHLVSLGFWAAAPSAPRSALAFIDHPRARVALEERGRWIPGWMLRHLYRPLIALNLRRFRRLAR